MIERIKTVSIRVVCFERSLLSLKKREEEQNKRISEMRVLLILAIKWQLWVTAPWGWWAPRANAQNAHRFRANQRKRRMLSQKLKFCTKIGYYENMSRKEWFLPKNSISFKIKYAHFMQNICFTFFHWRLFCCHNGVDFLRKCVILCMWTNVRITRGKNL